MKRSLLLSVVLTVLLFSGADVFAKSVDVQTARTVAYNFYKLNPNASSKSNLAVVLSYTKLEADSTVDFYVFNIYPVHSFVIVSGDDDVNPVIGYSTESYFNVTSSVEKIGVVNWMGNTAAKVHYAVQNKIAATADITNSWTGYINGNYRQQLRGAGAGPLLTTTWDQEPNYNALCPYNAADGINCLTGCVATTMAQIMKFWNYPAQGKGSFSYDDAPPTYTYNYGTQSANFGTTTYNWFNMPNSLSGSNSDVAKLMYQCGVSVTMNYEDDIQGGSGSYVLASETPPGQHSAQYAYTTYFLYNPKTIQGVVSQNYTKAAWIALIENEINNGRPVQYEGTDTSGYGGHTWVCDGYDASNLLHMNWGWSGQYDGYFDISNLNTDVVYNFDYNEAALIGIEPLATVQVTASATKTEICKGGSTKLAAIGPKNATYTWSPATGLACSTCSTTTAEPTVTTTYILKVDSSGVNMSLEVPINVVTGISSSFTPDVLASCSTPAVISFTNSSANAVSYLWEFGDGTTSSTPVPTHTYNSTGEYTVKLVATGPCGIDSISKPNLIKVSDNTPTVLKAIDTICRNQSATFSASGTGTINWFSALNGGTLVGAGSTFNTPDLAFPATFYAESDIENPVVSCPPANNGFASGTYFKNTNQHSIIFNCFKPQTLLSVDVYADGASERTIDLIDSAGNTINTVTINIPDGTSTLNLNFSLPVENNLKLSCGGNVYLYRNNAGATYPYYSKDSSVVLTNSDAGVPGYYYYFYNWQLQIPGCASTRIPVHVDLINPVTQFTMQITGNTATFSPANLNATSFVWDFGDGNTSYLENPSHTYTSSGNYTVKLTETGAICTDEISQTLSITVTGINNLAVVKSFNIYPNPVSVALQMEAGILPGASGDYIINIENMLGQTVLTQNVHLSAGDNKLSMDVSTLVSGVYLFRLTGKDGQDAFYKFVKD